MRLCLLKRLKKFHYFNWTRVFLGWWGQWRAPFFKRWRWKRGRNHEKRAWNRRLNNERERKLHHCPSSWTVPRRRRRILQQSKNINAAILERLQSNNGQDKEISRSKIGIKRNLSLAEGIHHPSSEQSVFKVRPSTLVTIFFYFLSESFYTFCKFNLNNKLNNTIIYNSKNGLNH
jgi:hypothetical protein